MMSLVMNCINSFGRTIVDNGLNFYLIEFTSEKNKDPVFGLSFSDFVTFWAEDIEHALEQLDEAVSNAELIQVYLCKPVYSEIR